MTKKEMQKMLAEFLGRELEEIRKNRTIKKDYKPFFEEATLKEKWLTAVEILRELEIDYQTDYREEVCDGDWMEYMDSKESDEFYDYAWKRALEEMKKEVK